MPFRRSAVGPARSAVHVHEPSARGQAPNPRLCYMCGVALIESIPNLSEGRRLDVVERLACAVRTTPGVRLLDHSSDPSHNRSVFTLAGGSSAVEAAILALFEEAVHSIDLRSHRGEHFRVGAVDVVPFVPLEGSTMGECVALARRTGEAVSARFGIPVYLYEEAATDPARRNLEVIRRGGFEGLAARMARADGIPDFGPRAPHPSAGAAIIGARPPLIAYNINLDTDRLEVAKTIAATIRESGGGLTYVKAAGFRLEHRRLVQVSMNLTNYRATSMEDVFAAVKGEADRLGVSIVDSEIIGLVPAAAVPDGAKARLQLAHFGPDQILERRLETTK
jgi:glutamate formiminotransferase